MRTDKVAILKWCPFDHVRAEIDKCHDAIEKDGVSPTHQEKCTLKLSWGIKKVGGNDGNMSVEDKFEEGWVEP